MANAVSNPLTLHQWSSIYKPNLVSVGLLVIGCRKAYNDWVSFAYVVSTFIRDDTAFNIFMISVFF